MNFMTLAAVGAVATIAVGAVAVSRAAADVAEPAYKILHAEDGFELRHYPELIVARVDRPGSRRQAVQRGFSPLAGYIFAKERDGAKIAMTAPVLQEPAAQGWTVSFIMPAEYKMQDLPAPTSDVRLETMPARTVAAIRFSGQWTDARFADAAGELTTWIEDQGARAVSAAEYGYYNDPFTPAFMRRNEVLIEVSTN